MRQVAKITCSSQVYFIVIFPCLPLVQGKPSFSLAKEYHRSKFSDLCVANRRFPGKKTFQLDFSGLCVANRLLPWQKISSLQIIRLMRGELSFHLSAC